MPGGVAGAAEPKTPRPYADPFGKRKHIAKLWQLNLVSGRAPCGREVTAFGRVPRFCGVLLGGG
jgi:hypothetical protein